MSTNVVPNKLAQHAPEDSSLTQLTILQRNSPSHYWAIGTRRRSQDLRNLKYSTPRLTTMVRQRSPSPSCRMRLVEPAYICLVNPLHSVTGSMSPLIPKNHQRCTDTYSVIVTPNISMKLPKRLEGDIL